MKIICCHLLNDYSGSPKVLMQLVKGWVKSGKTVSMLTCGNREGFLSHIQGVTYSFFWYKWSANNFVRLINYFLSQVELFFKVLFMVNKNDIVYVNTVLPFGAALAGKVKGCIVIYHVHEITVNPKILKWFLFTMVKHAATEIIYVSEYLSKQHKKSNKKTWILHNAIDDVFLHRAKQFKKIVNSYQCVLMVSSLKIYKGVFEFVALAEKNSSYEFKLVLNATPQEIDTFFKNTSFPKNLIVYPSQTNTHPFYEWADVLVNLSRPDGWIETFGLTVIEAMGYQLPCIVPPIGGIAELVAEGENGFLCDSRDGKLLSEKLTRLLEDKALYKSMQDKIRSKITLFSEDEFIKKSLHILDTV